MAFTKNEDAVSPASGVILMVAVTVILATVMAAFVYSMAGNISKTKVIAATVTQSESTSVIATYQGGLDASSCDWILWTVNQSEIANSGGYMCYGGTSSSASCAAGNRSVPVGTTIRLSASGGKDRVIGTAHFIDGSTQVIVETSI